MVQDTHIVITRTAHKRLMLFKVNNDLHSLSDAIELLFKEGTEHETKKRTEANV